MSALELPSVLLLGETGADSLAPLVKSFGYPSARAVDLAHCTDRQLYSDIVIAFRDGLEKTGAEYVESIREVFPEADLIVALPRGVAGGTEELLQHGAVAVLFLPSGDDEVQLALAQCRRHRADLLQSGTRFADIIGSDSGLADAFSTVQRLAPFTTTVLIQGESGTGKELVARAIHHHSPRSTGPFVAVNCGAITESLIESELFGHKRGAFTDAVRDKPGLFEAAHGGTLFLDEIGELPLAMQVKILRTIQEREIRRVGDERSIPIDVRILAATLRDLEHDVAAGRFREDLLYRLNVVTIDLPPLRERRGDIPALLKHFVTVHSRRLKLSPKKISAKALEVLVGYDWPGNVRELENSVERALVLSRERTIEVEHLSAAVREGASAPRGKTAVYTAAGLSIKKAVRTIEEDLIVRALEKTRGNRTHAAKLLEISHRALLYKIKRYRLGRRVTP